MVYPTSDEQDGDSRIGIEIRHDESFGDRKIIDEVTTMGSPYNH